MSIRRFGVVARRLNEFRGFLSVGHSVIGIPRMFQPERFYRLIGEKRSVSLRYIRVEERRGADRCFC
jgi:uncharacterized membrane protein